MIGSGTSSTEGVRRKELSLENKSGRRSTTESSSIHRPATSPTGECKSHHDSQMDSGFMSGSNLLSSSSLYSEEIGSRDPDFSPTHKIQQQHPPAETQTETSEILDSGIDLSERISSLNLSSSSVSHPLPSSSTIDAPESATVAAASAERPQNTEGRSKLAQLGLSPVHITILKEIFKKDEDGDTQLHVAVIRGFVEVVWHITRLLPHQALLDIPNNTGRTALHLAVASGDARLARHLIVCGASPVAKNRRGDTPLHIACQSGDPTMISGLTSQVTVFEVVTARLSYPPNHTPGLLAADLNNYDGQTCIHIAAQYGQKQVLQHLSWYGADINAKEGKCGRTALHFAVEARNEDLISFLVESCRAALSIANYAGLKPYQMAVANDAPEIINLLEKLGARKDPLPTAYSAEEDLDYEEESNFEVDEEKYPWAVDDLRINGVPQVPLQYSNPIPVSSHSPFNADHFL